MNNKNKTELIKGGTISGFKCRGNFYVSRGGIGHYCAAVILTFVPVMLWISALAAGVKVSIFTLIGMRLRRVIPSRVINP